MTLNLSSLRLRLTRSLLAALLLPTLALSTAACGGSRQAADQTDSATLRVMTFNIRYANPDDGPDYWDNRREAVVRMVRDCRPDILGIQEGLAPQVDFLDSALTDYTYVGVGRDDGARAGEYAAIFYRDSLFTPLEQGHFWLSETPDTPSMGWDAVCIRIATWVRLLDKASGHELLVFNTHFDHQGEKAQINSAKQIISQLKEYGNLPVVLTGDFNITESQQAYTTLTGNGSPLKDTYKIARKKEGVSYTYHNFSRLPRRKRKKVDYIFVTSPIKVAKINIPHEDAIPRNQISDHCPYIATLEF